jgi:hypothetical protein
MTLSKGARPSPAMMVALVALALALGGTAVADGITAKLDRAEKTQVKKIAKKQANKRITARAPGLAVASARTAASADSLNGLRVLPIKHQGPAGSGDVTVLDTAGLQIRVDDCTSGQEELRATTTIAGGEITVVSDDAGGPDAAAVQISHEHDSDFGPGDDFDLTEAISAVDDRIYQLHYTGGDGRLVSASIATEGDIGGLDCVVSGYAVVTG